MVQRHFRGPGKGLARDFNMAPVWLKEVIVYSSQDPVHRADNLLQLSSQWKRWLCAPGDRSGSMQAEFQLEKTARIGYMDIGNYGSAFVEALVRKSSWPSNKYVTLIPATMLMSPMESKNGQNKCVVKMFTKAALNEESLEGEWDRIKVICSQPYKKDAQFGLAFIRLRSLEEQREHIQTVSPGPTMTKLHSNSNFTPTANKPRSRTILSPSWKTNSNFQRQFISSNDGSNKYSDAELKTRLLKMVATTDTGSDKADSLSRSAKMVLASTNNKQPTPKRQPGNHDNIQSPPLINSRSSTAKSPHSENTNRHKIPSGQRRYDSNVENHNISSTPRTTNCDNNCRANKDSAPQISPVPRFQHKSGSDRQDSYRGVDQDQRGRDEKTPVSRQPTKRQSNFPAETSPTKMRSVGSHRHFKEVAEDVLISLDSRLLDSKLSDIRPIIKTLLGRKLSKEEKETLKELAVQRVEFLIKTGSSPTATRPSQCPQPQRKPNLKLKLAKPQPLTSTSSSPGSISSNVTDAMPIEFRNCPNCYLQFTTKQITGHVLTCQGIKSAGGITTATNASFVKGINSFSVPKRGGGRRRGRGRGGQQGVASFSAVDKDVSSAASSHIRTAQMPSYQHEGAVAKQKRGGRTVGSTLRNSSGPSEGILEIQKTGGFFEAAELSPAHTITTSTQGITSKPRQHNVGSSNMSPKSSSVSQMITSSPSTLDGACSDACSEYVEYAPCPICCDTFPMVIIEEHADLCLERNMILSELSNQQSQMECF